MLHLKEYLSDVKPGIALDVGTRFGEFAFTLVEAMPEGSRIIGIDCDAATVEQAKEKSSQLLIEAQGEVVLLSANKDYESGGTLEYYYR